MIPQIQSWEFIFVGTLILVLVFPLISRYIGHKAYLWPLIFFFPHFLGAIENACGIDADFSFFLILATLHWSVSALSMWLLWKVPREMSYKRFYATVILSGCLSCLYPLTSSTMILNDLFWGVIPGTVTIDPIISLNSYFFRLGYQLITIAIFVTYRKPYVFILVPLILSLFFSRIYPTSFSAAKNWILLQEKSNTDPALHLYRGALDPSGLSDLEWLKILNQKLSALRSKLPSVILAKETHSSDLSLQIFIYSSDDQKADWVGARSTQIGHFIRGEMQISELDPQSLTLSHELAHLLHGKLTSDIKSYLDPFWFEGFAVALSEESATIIEKGAALHAEISRSQQFEWPRGLQFFGRYPSRAAYVLAGAHAAWHLNQNQAPWNHEPSVSIFKSVTVSEQTRKWASDLLNQKPLIKNPRLRDCARLQHSFRKKYDSKTERKLDRLCPLWRQEDYFK